jgi:predicted RNA methylase
MANVRLTAVVWREGRRYVSQCPELGVASYGDRPWEAVEALREAVELYLANAKELGMLGDIEPVLNAAERYTTSFDVAIA